MKKNVALMAMAILFTTTALQAQNSGAATYNTKGFFLNASALGASWTMDDLNFDDEYGGGAGLKLGYNFTKNLGLFTSMNAAVMSPDEDPYVLAHLDLGLQGTLGAESSRLKPYLNVAASAMTAQDDETEINGAGLSIGGGILLFMSRSVALDIGYTHGLIELSEAKYGSQTVDLDESATTMRLQIGLGFYF